MIVSATGHRPDKLGGYSSDLALLRVEMAMDWLQASNAEKGIGGMALGWDQDFALACFELGIPYVAAIPFAGQESIWPAKSKRQYRWLMNRAAEIVVVCEGGYGAHKMQVRNQWMVDRCDTLLALHDGSAGGTGNCIKYAQEWDVRIVNLWEEYSLRRGHR